MVSVTVTMTRMMMITFRDWLLNAWVNLASCLWWISLHLALFRTGIEKAEALDMKEQLVTDARRVLKEEKAWLFKQKLLDHTLCMSTTNLWDHNDFVSRCSRCLCMLFVVLCGHRSFAFPRNVHFFIISSHFVRMQQRRCWKMPSPPVIRRA